MTEEYPKIALNYARDLEIDQNQLELEWLSIAKQIMAYSEAHVQAQFNRDRAKQRRDVAEAELDRIARSEPIPEDLPISAKTGQPTETAVLNWVHKQPKYQEAQRERQEAEYVVNMLQAAVFAFQAKKTALENLVRLFGLKYYAEPYEPPGSDIKPQAMERGRLAATEAMRKDPGIIQKTTLPEVNQVPPVPSCNAPAVMKGDLFPNKNYRYAIGPITEHGRHAFTAGPYPELQRALDWTGKPGDGIYRLIREQPDELIRVWSDGPPCGWVEHPPRPAPKTSLPPRPPQRPLPKRP